MSKAAGFEYWKGLISDLLYDIGLRISEEK